MGEINKAGSGRKFSLGNVDQYHGGRSQREAYKHRAKIKGVRFGRDAKGNPEVIIPKGSPALDNFIKAGLVKDIYIPTRFPRQAFFISHEVFKAISPEEVEATYKDMVELGIANPPYPDYDLILSSSDIYKMEEDRFAGRPFDEDDFGKSTTILRFHDETLTDALFDWNQGRPPFSLIDPASQIAVGVNQGAWERFRDNLRTHSQLYRRMFIVLLATKNIVKETKVNKLAKLGIGKKDRHWYTTTLKIGTIKETVRTAPGAPTGREIRPHLRRGHKRKQRFGPRNEFYKFIWIEPTFVNADEDFISTRTGYNVSKAQ